MTMQPSRTGGAKAYCTKGHEWTPGRYEAVAFDIEVGGKTFTDQCAKCLAAVLVRLFNKVGTYSETDPALPAEETAVPVSERWMGPELE